jgi:streptogramin lyase
MPYDAALDASGNLYVVDTGNARIQKFDGSGTFLLKWGSSGAGAGQFSTPFGIVVDASGDVLVADTVNDRIQKFDPYGNFIAEWGALGTGDGQFDKPYGVAVDSSGNVYVTDHDNDRVQKFDGSGSYLTQWGSSGSAEGELLGPAGVAVDSSGNVYVAESDNQRIQKFDGSGTFLLMWGWGVDDGTAAYQVCTSASAPCQAGASGSGDGQLFNPFGVEVDTAGNVYVADTDNDRIQEFDSSGTFLTRWGIAGSGEGQFDSPEGVTVDSSGYVYVVDTGNDRIQKFGHCSFSTTPSTGLFGFAAVTASFDVDPINDACGWAATSNHSWITVTSGPGGIGNGTVGYSVDPNPTAYSRGGSISIADRYSGGPGHTFAIIQDPAPCTASLLPAVASFSGTAGADFLSVNSPIGCPWTAVSNDGWISVDAGAAGNGSAVVLYSVAANPGSDARTGTMTVAGHTFTVNQDPQVPDAAPTNLVCTAVNSNKINVAWTENAGNEAWLEVERKVGAGGTFARAAVLPPDTSGFIDSGLTGHTLYVYRVMACNSAGCSAPSNEATETTPALGVFIGEVSR